MEAIKLSMIQVEEIYTAIDSSNSFTNLCTKTSYMLGRTQDKIKEAYKRIVKHKQSIFDKYKVLAGDQNSYVIPTNSIDAFKSEMDAFLEGEEDFWLPRFTLESFDQASNTTPLFFKQISPLLTD